MKDSFVEMTAGRARTGAGDCLKHVALGRTPGWMANAARWLRASGATPLRQAGIKAEMTGLVPLIRVCLRGPTDGEPWWKAILDAFGVAVEHQAARDSGIPHTGGIVVVANHPLGIADGLALLATVKAVRPDVKVIANRALRGVAGTGEDLLFVDVLAPGRTIANAVAMRSAIRWVKNGGALIVFPAGEVSHVGTEDGRLVDRRWSHAVGRLVQHTGSDVVPIFVAGRNSTLFRVAGLVHPLLRTALLPSEFLRLRGKTVRVRVGSPIPFSRLAELGKSDRIADYLRFRTYALSESTRSERVVSTPAAALSAAEPAVVVQAELASLPASAALVRCGAFDVYLARAGEIPCALREIGRLRELAFRAAGEGTGRERDLDRFDTHYRHLFVWHRERREIAGAYRMGPTDEILPALGIAGLYTSTLFQFDHRLIRQIAPALELGRAFVRPEYQKEYQPLLLLWRAIATFVSREPRYRMLFGPVSISNEYASLSRQILTKFLMATSYRADLGELVAAANPPRFLRAGGRVEAVAGPVVERLADVAAMVADIEGKSKGIPVLVRQYLKLNAKLLGFNVDPAFGDALDGLMLVDLTQVDRTVLDRYMGRSAADGFLAYHGAATRRRAS